MSTYVKRIIECYVSDPITGVVSINNLDELNNLPEYKDKMIYYIKDIPWAERNNYNQYRQWIEDNPISHDGHWIELKEREKHWQHLRLWYNNCADDIYYFDEGYKDTVTMENGETIKVHRFPGFINNGGDIRDYYLNNWGPYTHIQNRGVASDISESAKAVIDSYEGAYNHTHVTLSELCSISTQESTKFKSELEKKIQNNQIKDVKALVEEIHNKVYNPDVTLKKKSKKKKNQDEEYDGEDYDSLDYFYEEEGGQVMSIKFEINHIYALVDMVYGYLSDENIRIHYFFC